MGNVVSVRLFLRHGEILIFRMHFLCWEKNILSVKTLVPQENNGLGECYLILQSPYLFYFVTFVERDGKNSVLEVVLSREEVDERLRLSWEEGEWGGQSILFCLCLS